MMESTVTFPTVGFTLEGEEVDLTKYPSKENAGDWYSAIGCLGMNKEEKKLLERLNG